MPDLIDIAYIRTFTRLNAGVEERRVGNGIVDAHLELEKVLGRTGYALVYANAPTFTAQAPDAAAYVTLLTDYIKPYLAWKSREKATVDMHIDAEKGGVFIKGGSQSGEYQSVGRSDLGVFETNAQARADERLTRLLDHLCDNTATFTWYTTNVNGEERIDKTNAKSVAGLSFRVSQRQSSNRG